MAPSPASIAGPLSRGLTYASTSLLAHLSGYLLQAEPWEWSDAPLVIALWTTTLPFFLAYSIAFSHDGAFAEQPDSPPRWAKENSWPVVIGGAMLLTAVLLLCSYAVSGTWPNTDYWIALVSFAVLFVGYGHFTLARARLAAPIPIRHQLVWPVAFSIALPLYSGEVFGTDGSAKGLLWPPASLITYFLLSSFLAKRSFAVISGALVCVTVLATAFTTIEYLSYFPLMIFVLAIAAYLAVFEAWAVTSALKAQGRDASRFYLATFAAQLTSSLSLPFLFVLSEQGYIFLGGLLIHCLLSLGLWYWLGNRLHLLSSPRWLVWKTFAGFLFLAIVVVDSALPVLPSQRLVASFVTIGVPSYLLAVALAALAIRGALDLGQPSFSWLLTGNWTRKNLLALACGLAILMMGATVFIESLLATVEPASLAKADGAFMSYLVTFAAYLTTIIRRNSAGSGGGAILGVLISIRPFTSLVVALVAVLPHIRAGASLLPAIVTEALPFALAAAGGFLLNDAHDWKRDLIDKPYRPIPQGLLSPRLATRAGWTVLTVAVTLVFVDGFNETSVPFQLGAIVGVTTYNSLVRAFSWAKGLLAAGVAILPVASALALDPTPGLPWFLMSVYFFLVGRELLMDILDARGDRLTGRLTAAVRLGATRAERVAFALFIAAATFLVAGVAIEQSVTRAAACSGALALLGLVSATWLTTTSSLLRRRAIWLSWVPMIAALFSMM